MTHLLSIAIPTYNRSSFLEKALERLFACPEATNNQIEIVISDNASTDNTNEIVNNASKKYNKEIKYFKNIENIGIDGNIHSVVNHCTGNYVWLLSDDDIASINSINYILKTIHENDFCFCFLNGTPLEANNIKIKTVDTQFDIKTNSNDIFIDKIWIWATFISSFVFKRTLWTSIKNREKFIGTDIYLTYILFHLLSQNSQSTKIISAETFISIRNQYTGSYKILRAFGLQWFKLLTVDAQTMGFSKETLSRIAKKSITRDLIFRVYAAKSKQKRFITMETLYQLTRYTYKIPTAWIILYPIALTPLVLIKLSKYLSEKFGIKIKSQLSK